MFSYRTLSWKNCMLTGLWLLRCATRFSNEQGFAILLVFSQTFLTERCREAAKIENARSWGVQGDNRSRLFGWSYCQRKSDLSFLPPRVLSLQVRTDNISLKYLSVELVRFNIKIGWKIWDKTRMRSASGILENICSFLNILNCICSSFILMQSFGNLHFVALMQSFCNLLFVALI